MADLTADNRNIATVERVIPASPEAIFDLLADPARHKEIDGSGTVRGPSEGSKRLALGDVFGMSMKLGIGYEMANTVVELEENRRIAWQPQPVQKLMRYFAGGRIWRYELEPLEGGTKVREQWDISKEAHPFMVRPMRKKTVENMEKTLARIEEIVTGKG
jgi:hypothetical protein